MKKHLKRVMKEMCSRVGVDFNKMDFKKKEWFYKYEWTETANESFRKWMVKYLYDSLEARREIMKFPMKRRNRCENAVNWFIFDYGWKLKNE